MKRTVIALATVATLMARAAHADALTGQKMAAGANGQPICTESVDDLKEFMMAAMTGDNEQLGAILKEGNCTMLKKGTAIAVLEDLPSENDDIHVVKIRAMNKKGSVIGYSLSVGMVARK